MTPSEPPRPDPPLPPPLPADVEWEELVLGTFGPRHWNVGCG